MNAVGKDFVHTPVSFFYPASELPYPTENFTFFCFRVPPEFTSEILAEIYANLECPVCSNYMSPPIPECVNKHSLCNFCYQRVNTCPLCRAPKNPHGTSFVLGEIYNILMIPCKNRDRGCRYFCRGRLLHNHEPVCEYRSRICLVNQSQDCNWEGSLMEIKDHMVSRHSSNFCLDRSKETFVLTGFRENRRYKYFTMIFYAYEKFFRLTWNIDRSGKIFL